MRKIFLIALFFITFFLYFNFFGIKDGLYRFYSFFVNKTHEFLDFGINNEKNLDNICKLNFYTLSLNSLIYENEELRKLLNYKTGDDFLAKVVDKNIKKSFYLLDSDSSLQKKYIAISAQGYALGFAKMNTLFLFSAPKKSIDAYILKDNKKIALRLEALMPGSFKSELNKEFEVNLGDKVYFDKWPVGIVYKIEESKNSPYNNLYIALPFNLSNLSYILLVEYE